VPDNAIGEAAQPVIARAEVLAYRGHLLTENRNGLVVSTLTTRAYGSAERDAALLMAEGLPKPSEGRLEKHGVRSVKAFREAHVNFL
jgi:hypothetical protein